MPAPILPIPELPHSGGDRRHWGNLPGSSRSLALHEAALKHTGPLLVITADTQSALELEQELRFFNRSEQLPLLTFPDWETLPYDSFSPHQDIISQRLYTLYTLPTLSRGILIVPAPTLMHRTAPSQYVSAHTLALRTGQRFDLSAMRKRLEAAGYHCVETVYEHGEFAVRGAIMDIFPMGSVHPYRIDLFDDEIETLRVFDPDTQRSIRQVDEIRLLPAKEFPLDPDSIAAFRLRWRELFDVDPRQCPVYQDVGNGIATPGLEYYLPLFFEHTACLTDYLPDTTLVIDDSRLTTASEQFWQEAQRRYEDRRYDLQRPVLPPQHIFLAPAELFQAINRFPRLSLHPERLDTARAGHHDFDCQAPPELPVDARAEQPLAALTHFMEQHADARLLFCAESAGRRETLLELLARIPLQPPQFDTFSDFLASDARFGMTVAPLERGLWLTQPNTVLITEAQLFGQRVMQRRRRRRSQDVADQVIKNLTELQLNAPVVHADHGVGRYLGLQTLQVDGQAAEFLTLEYAEGAKLYVPVASLHLISRYTGAGDEAAPLHKLGSEQWQRAKRKAAEQVRDAAAELLDIYARRAARKGFAFTPPDEAYEQFAASFPFEETPDQQAAISAVINDMTATQPMDRVVCGDVGFGKTEVAMRAAFLAAQSGKQVAVLVPTTLLAQQHYASFRDRFADWPVQVEVLSRFRSGKEQEQVLQKLADGATDIIIGTHKLLQQDIRFKRLGLLIIDEEHRFGVQQKEKLKALRAEVDILTLTATPIPRTLNMAMSGIRDLSIIATPPARRLSVKTFVRQRDPHLVKEAILRELLRGGQVYYLHNEVKSIEKAARELQELVPEARIGVAHGQLAERQLEQVMSDFYHKRFNILVCSTIIETGIDIPSANTIVIERADKFGLAQLHQLRGRVGRSHHQAYAYLLTPPPKSLTPDATKRLEAIAAAEDLGAGFTLATHDLEIRGAGELLGEGQSGQIQHVGFSLYMEMLERAVKAIKSGQTPNLDQPLRRGAEINLHLPALIPEDYLPDVHSRLIMYKRIANAQQADELKELQVEMIDRFGLLPQPVKNLFRLTELKLRVEPLGIIRLDAGPNGGRCEFSDTPNVDPLAIVQLVQRQPQIYRLEGANRLKFTLPMASADQRFSQVNHLVDMLSQPSTDGSR